MSEKDSDVRRSAADPEKTHRDLKREMAARTRSEQASLPVASSEQVETDPDEHRGESLPEEAGLAAGLHADEDHRFDPGIAPFGPRLNGSIFGTGRWANDGMRVNEARFQPGIRGMRRC